MQLKKQQLNGVCVYNSFHVYSLLNRVHSLQALAAKEQQADIARVCGLIRHKVSKEIRQTREQTYIYRKNKQGKELTDTKARELETKKEINKRLVYKHTETNNVTNKHKQSNKQTSKEHANTKQTKHGNKQAKHTQANKQMQTNNPYHQKGVFLHKQGTN